MLYYIEAPLIAKAYRAGNFVIIRVGEKGERIPLTIAHADAEKGIITLVIQKVGLSSSRLCDLNEGDCITDVVGPLGQATTRLFVEVGNKIIGNSDKVLQYAVLSIRETNRLSCTLLHAEAVEVVVTALFV